MNSKKTEAVPTAETTVEEPEERRRCAVCEQTFYRDHGSLQLRCGALICPFCAVYLAPEPRPVMVATPDDDMELLGAWSSFADDCVQWHLGLSWKYRQAKLDMDALLPEALAQWALGSLYDDGAQGSALGEVWPVLAYGHILKLTEVAATLADKLHEEPDLTAIRAAIARPEVAPVWQLWLAANAEDGLSEAGYANAPLWYCVGARHGKAYYERRSPEYIEKLRAGYQRWKSRVEN